MKEEIVILVNEFDVETGVMEKMEAHRKGLLHRAFSIFIFNSNGEILLQQRATGKYHSGGLWTNACCSHPRQGEELMDAAHRRLLEEMGISTGLEKLFDFIYRAEVDHGLTEYEFDHVLAGIYDDAPEINREEVTAFSYRSVSDIEELLYQSPEIFTPWFRIAFPRVKEWIY